MQPQVMTQGEAKGGEILRPEAARAAEMVERRCIVTGITQDKADLLRFVLAPDGMVTPDLMGRLPGRGIWVTARRVILDQAVGKNLFSRAAKQAAQIPNDLPDLVTQLLHRHALDALGLARRAGLAVAGFEKVREAADGGRAAVLLEAYDGAPDGKTKLARLAPQAIRIDFFSAAELGAVFGRDHVVHGALASHALTDRALWAARRMQGYNAPFMNENQSEPSSDLYRKHDHE